jgi:DNA modification methylase
LDAKGWAVVEADCRGVLAALPDRSVDMVMTDPPYGHNNNNGDLIHSREAALGKTAPNVKAAPRPIANDGPEANDLIRDVLPHVARLLRHGGCCCCCCGGGGPDPQFARWSLWIDEHLDFKQMVVWDKGPMGMGWHYRRSYETVLVATKRGGPCKWYDSSDRIENVIRPGARGAGGGEIRKIIPKANDHPTPKPWELAAHFVALHTAPGDLVLDPFAGHGWVGVACRHLGRRYLGVEISAEFVREARRKIAAALSPQTSRSEVAQDAELFMRVQDAEIEGGMA